MRKFHRKRGQRRSFLKGLATNLIMRERIETTTARAKEIRSMVERMLVTAQKRGVVNALRSLAARLSTQAAEKLVYEIAPRYKGRRGGYLRVIKEATSRKRDGASLSLLEFVK